MKHALLKTIESPADVRRLSRGELKQLAQSNCATSCSRACRRPVATCRPTWARWNSRWPCTPSTTRPTTGWCGTLGHQTYPHKILTGRREQMHSLRQIGGIGGFPRREESEYDTFGTAHSSTSISAALGMAVAARQKGESAQRRWRSSATAR